jgi:hypothetical protein
MGIFSKRTSSQSRNQGSNSRQSTIQHLADWGQNAAMFYINPDGVSWSYKKEMNFMFDETATNAALAQLQRAYHMSVSYPDAEEQMLAPWRTVSDEMPEGALPDFNWQPPLPGN